MPSPLVPENLRPVIRASRLSRARAIRVSRCLSFMYRHQLGEWYDPDLLAALDWLKERFDLNPDLSRVEVDR